jgi:hypothetical protein
MELPKDLKLVSGVGSEKGHTACLFSARALLDGRGFTDGHPSAVLRAFGIGINDSNWWPSDEERTAVLLPIALDERLCASKCDASPEAEQIRAYLCADFAVRVCAPAALRAARLDAEAAKLEALPEITDRETAEAAEAAEAAAYAARAAAWAAAWAARAAEGAEWARAAEWAEWAAAEAARAAEAAAYAARAAEAAAEVAEVADGLRDQAIALFVRMLDVKGGG